jgi:GT2 family glycosyltransferase
MDYQYTWSIITPVCGGSMHTSNLLSWHFNTYIQSKRAPVEIIIVDNGSKDATPSLLEAYKANYGDSLKIITNEQNEGFGDANNAAFFRAKGAAVLFLNNDVIFHAPYLKTLDSVLAANPEALIGPQHINHDTGWNVFGETIVSYIAGWCLAMKAETFEALGLFDPIYKPADFEDVDLCYHAGRMGRDLIKVELPLTHISDQTGRRVLPNRREITIRNRQRFADKWGLVAVPKT